MQNVQAPPNKATPMKKAVGKKVRIQEDPNKQIDIIIFKRKWKPTEKHKSPHKKREIDITEKATSAERRIYDYLVNDPSNKEQEIFKMGPYIIKKQDFNTFKEGEWLLSHLVDLWAEMLNEREILKSTTKPRRLYIPSAITVSILIDVQLFY